MTDLHEAFDALVAGEPAATSIDPYAAVRTSRARTRASRQRWLAAGVTTALVIGAVAVIGVQRLGSSSTPAALPAASAPVSNFDPASIDCDLPPDPTSPQAQHLPIGFGPIAAAYRCRIEERKVPGDGSWRYQVVSQVTGDLEGLQQLLDQPDADRSLDPACSLAVTIGPAVWVVGPSGSALVRLPLSGCGAPMSGATKALNRLPTEVVNETKLRQTESQVAVDSGCSQDFGDQLREDATDDRRAGPDTALPRLDDGLSWTACRYDVTAGGDAGAVGSLVSANRLTASQLAKVNAALALSRPDKACQADHTRFAILTDGESNNWIDVALDGCAVQNHSVVNGTSWWRADDSLRALLS